MITDADFAKFSRVVAQGIFPSPIQPAAASSIYGFEVGVGATGISVDKNASWWQNSVGKDFSTGGYVGVPRLIISKGIGAGNLSASYAKIFDTSATTYGGSLDWALLNGGLVSPTLAVRGTYGTLKGIDGFDLNTYGAEVFLSKGFTVVTPYGAVGKWWSNGKGIVSPARELRDDASGTRWTVGLRFSFLVPKIVIEATQGEERSYSAKLSFGI